MKLTRFIDTLKTHADFGQAFVFQHYVPPREAVYGSTPLFHADIQKAMDGLKIGSLYTHQIEAIHHLRAGKNVLVATETASGKTLVYTLSVLEKVLQDPNARALFLFPLKALEHDQLKNFSKWLEQIESVHIRAAIYDGDTTPHQRKQIRRNPPHVLFTNPDMLHRGILPHHETWENLFKNLSFVVLDEVHTYRGIFGSHLSQIIRRLRRICRFYGADPQFVLLSATVANPETFGKDLIQQEIEVVQSSGAPKSGQHVVFLNPGGSANFSSARLFTECVQKGFRTIVFAQARKVTELIHLWVNQLTPAIRHKISSYRAGFLPEERRRIERRLSQGELLGVVSTSALELGIDIGYLDICLLVGYPGTIINTWQRGGRVGRSGRESMILLVAKPDALDQYFMKHPHELFERSFEAAILDPNNPYVVKDHLVCTAAELPLTHEDKRFWPQDMVTLLDQLENEGRLSRTADGDPMWFSVRRNPQLSVNIRSAGETFTIFERETGQAIGTVDGFKAFKECHPGAIYLHRARQYEVDHLFLDKKDVVVHQSKLKYFTRARSEKETEIIKVHQSRPKGQFIVREGILKVTEIITGYEKRSLPGQGLVGVFPLEDLPPQIFETSGFWVEIEPILKRFVEKNGLHFMGGIHAIEHAAIGIFPLFALCDRNDIGGICYPHHPQVGKSAIFIYDAYPGGVGLARRGFETILELLEKTWELVKSCECEDGCPSCIHSPKCGNGNKPLDKAAAQLILEGLLGHVPFSDMAEETDDEEPAPVFREKAEDEEKSSGPRILYFDLETQKTAQDVGGWHNTHLMRISVAVLFDTLENRFLTFEEDRIDDLVNHLKKGDLIVGFNIVGFDYKVLGAYTEVDLKGLPTFDILADIHQRLGFRLGLDHLATETLGTGKTAHGLQAVEWFRQGEMEKLSLYCRHDVEATRDLFQYGFQNGHIVYRKKGVDTRLRLLVDWNLEELVKQASNETRDPS